MTKIYPKEEFLNLDFDTRCSIIEELMPNDYYGGQEKIGFWIPENYTGKNGEPLPPTPPEIEAEEDKKFIQLIDELTIQLFNDKDSISCDIEMD
ncbi:MAG: hypothetical protein K9H64_21995 [Bacteroidales bacterium]|nr:hypothetical protein [Bacteroidales bacterium]